MKWIKLNRLKTCVSKKEGQYKYKSNHLDLIIRLCAIVANLKKLHGDKPIMPL